MSPLKRSNNIAARMGRWSASHWKNAVFGWLAFVVALVAIGTFVGTKHIDRTTRTSARRTRPTRSCSTRDSQIDPQTEFVLVQSKTRTVDDAAFRDASSRTRSWRCNRTARSQEPAARRSIPRNRTRSRRTATRRMVQFGHERHRRGREAKISTRIVTATDRRPGRASRLLRRRGRLDQSTGKALDKMFNSTAQAGRRALDPAHALRPAARLRRARRRGRAAAARTLGRVRDDRPRRTAEPHRSRWTRTSRQ